MLLTDYIILGPKMTAFFPQVCELRLTIECFYACNVCDSVFDWDYPVGGDKLYNDSACFTLICPSPTHEIIHP